MKINRLFQNKGACVLGMLVFLTGFMRCETLDFTNPNSPDLSSASDQALVTGALGFMRAELDVYLQSTITLGREGYFFEPADPRFTGELLFGPVDAGGFLSTRPWDQAYRVIFNCNQLLERAAALSGAEAAGLEGFAKTLRAYNLLFILVYVDEDAQGRSIRTNFDGNRETPFASKTEAFDFIETDLEQGLAALNNPEASFATFSLSSGFSGFDTPVDFAQFNRAISARARIYRNDFNGALASLNQSFLNAGGDLNAGVYHVYSTAENDRLNPVFEVPDAPGLKLHAHTSFEADAESGDLRFANKTFKRAANDAFDGLNSDLAIILNFESGTYSSTSSVPIIRNEELILIRAEANIGLGNFAEAETDLNIVRAAAGLAGYTGTAASNALDRLLHERRYSLFGEGHRWVDMRRYGRLAELPIDRPERGDMHITRMKIPEGEFSEQ